MSNLMYLQELNWWDLRPVPVPVPDLGRSETAIAVPDSRLEKTKNLTRHC